MIPITDIIQLLPEHVANQIAAGEVVQRPASVVKELMENAVDAGSTQIELIVKNAGRTLIQTVDDGLGMSVTDLRMAFERHATSKIRTTEDIFHITTKGFRGEALPSIAAVAQVEALSKTEQEEVGNRLVIEGGTVRDQSPAAAPRGTSVAVKNLFYNVPARRNFLKSNHVEFRHIQDEFLRVSLAHPHISFKLYHNDSEVYLLPPAPLKQRLVHVFGRKMDALLIPVSEETEIVKIHGYIGKPETARKQRGEQFFFVNDRFIRSNYLHKAVLDAFENLLPDKYVPSYFLYLEIDPSKIDINIHPTKTEIKFEDDHGIYAVLRATVKHALGQFSIFPSLDFDQNPDWAFIPPAQQKGGVRVPEIKVDPGYNPFHTSPGKSEKSALQGVYGSLTDVDMESNLPSHILSKDEFEWSQHEVLQWLNRYLVIGLDDELLIIDQNRAHQLVLYERYKSLSHGNPLSQRLLFPVEISSNPTECGRMKNIEEELISFGFDVDFKEDEIHVHAIPSDLKTEDVPAVFENFFHDLDWHNQIDFTAEIPKIIAKNSAVKKGEPLLPEESRKLVRDLMKLEEPNFTPYGKPIFFRITEEEVIQKLN